MFFPLFLFITGAISLIIGQNAPNESFQNKTEESLPLPISISAYSFNKYSQNDFTNGQLTIEFSIKGEKFEIWGDYDVSYGEFEIYLDDIFLSTINQNQNQKKCQLQYTSELFEYGHHIIKLIGKGKRYEICKFNYWPSIHAKRLNLSEFKNFNWDEESDKSKVRYRPSSNMNSEIEKEKVLCSKIWIYGSKSIEFGSFTLNLSNRYSFKIDEKSDKKIECELLYETDYFDLDEYTIKLIYNDYSEGGLELDCIYYVQTLSTEKSKSIFLSNENQDYSNDIFENINETIYINNEYLHQEVTNSQFIDCEFSDFLFVVQKNFAFENVKFIFNETKNEQQAIIKIENNLEVTIQNCEFIKCSSGQSESGIIMYVPNSEANENDFINIQDCYFKECVGTCCYFDINSNSNEKISIQSCSFEHCQNGNEDIGNIIHISEGVKSPVIYNCTFLDCSSNDALFSYSSSSQLDSLELQNIVFLCCNSFSSSLIKIQNVDSANISNSNFRSCSGDIFSLTNDNLIFDTCTFESNDLGTNGCIYINSTNIVTIKSCQFLNNQDSKIQCKVGGVYIVSNDSFEPTVNIMKSSFANQQDFQTANSIFIEGSTAHLIISDTQFINSEGLKNYTIMTESSNLSFSDVTFECLNPILFNNIETIQNIEFENVKSIISSLLVVPQTNSYAIDNCSFHNCKSTNSVIRVDADQFEIYNSIIEFDEADYAKSCSGIHIRYAGDYKIISTSFIKIVGKGIYYFLMDSHAGKSIEVIGCTFDSCNGEDTNAIKLYLNGEDNYCFFQNCTIKNIENARFSVVIDLKNLDEFHFDSIKFIKNSMTVSDPNSGISYGGGSGIWINRDENDLLTDDILGRPIKKKSNLIFTNCQFIDNTDSRKEGGGAFHLGDSLINFETTFSRCRFERNSAIKGGALEMETIYPLTISECEFIDNKVTGGDQFGGAIYLNPKRGSYQMEKCVITQCSFIGNQASNGHVIFVEKEITTDIFINSTRTFTNNNNQTCGGSAILFYGQKLQINSTVFSEEKYSRFLEICENCDVELSCVDFVDCNEKDGDGNAIKINSNVNHVSLTSCTFTNCGNKGYIITDLGAELSFDNCSFAFDDDTACCALDIQTNKLFEIRGCTFIKNKNANEESSKSGTLYYHPDSPTVQAVFTSCSFIECTGNLYKTFSIRTSIEPEFSYITINNTGTMSDPTGYVGEIYLTGVASFSPTFCSINNNFVSSEYGGGILIKTSSPNDIFDLKFQSCEWTNNHAIYSQDIGSNRYNDVGGAYQRGIDASLSKVTLTFDNCTFLENKSDREGGALAIQTVKHVSILNCYFKRNHAGVNVPTPLTLLETSSIGYGGAIYIDPDFSDDQRDDKIPSVDIQQTKFIENEAISGHAIYIRGRRSTSLNIQENNIFTDNGKNGATIYMECNDFNIDSSNVFNFTRSSESSYPYEFGPGSTAKYENTVFNEIYSSGTGDKRNTIHIGEGVLTPIISNCTFINCGSSGFVITIYPKDQPVVFVNNTIIFDDHTNACKGLGIFGCNRQMQIEDCAFQRCNDYNEQQTAGGILMSPVNDELNTITGQADIHNITFHEMFGQTQRCFSITWPCIYLHMSHIYILNCIQSGYTGALYLYSTNISTFLIEDWVFFNNAVDSEFGGGCGLWVEPTNKGSEFELTFQNCIWNGNEAKHTKRKGEVSEGRTEAYNGLGGACQFGFSATNAKCKLTFFNCTFNENKADCEGGALAIQTINDCTIENCSFTSNHANRLYDQSEGFGGAIYIDPDFINNENYQKRSPKVYIQNCTFDTNDASVNGHALSLSGDEAEVTIQDCTFSDNGHHENSVIYSICPTLTIERNTFTSNGIQTRAIELAVFSVITIDQCSFVGCSSSQNGGAILLRPLAPVSQSVTLLKNYEDQEYKIYNCQFTNCNSQGSGGSLFISEQVNSVELKNTTFDGGAAGAIGNGVAIYISDNVQSFTINKDSNVKFINQNCHNKFLISSSCQQFAINDIEISNSQLGKGIKGIQIIKGTATIKNIFFSKCISGIEIKSGVSEATIQDCIFSDCYYEEGNGFIDQVALIENSDCVFTRNIVNFTDKNKAICGLKVTSNGDIEITHNKFIRVKASTNVGGGIFITDTASQPTGSFRFNYNLIEDVGDAQFSGFNVQKCKAFNFDHNTIKGCGPILKGNYYLCNLDIRNNEEFKQQFSFTNWTLSGCHSKYVEGGAFSLWILFENYIGTLTLRDCLFENNNAENAISPAGKPGGYGGGFSSGLSSLAGMQIIVDGCTFNNNNAAKSGGALSLQSSGPIEVTNCSFINNQATEGGGAIYIHPNNDGKGLLDKCLISGCNFENNKDSSNNGHAIFFEENEAASTILTIEENCIFKNNENFDNYPFEGYVIVSMAPTLEFIDSRIDFSDDHGSAPALKLAGSSTSILNNVYFFKTNSYFQTGYDANAIFIDSTTTKAEINFCTFDRCGVYGAKSAIVDKGKETIIDNCKFLNDEPSYGCKTGAVYVKSQGKHVIQNCFTQYNWGDEGAFQYNPEIVASDTRSFTFRNITIDDVMGNNNIAINFYFNNQDRLDIGNVTIKNTRKQGIGMVQFDLAEDIDEFTIDEFRFINNYVRNNFMGGSGMWIKTKEGASIKFDRCHFERNEFDIAYSGVSTSGCGGAFSIGNNADIIYSQITMTECQFIGNHAEKHGGALAFSNLYPVSIIDCTFTDNKANGRAGAIYIDFPDHVIASHTFTITGCNFNHNTASDSSSSFFIESNGQTLIDVSSSTFSDNLDGYNIIYSRAANLIVHDMNFEFPDTNRNVRPLHLGSQSNTEVYNVKFVKCSSGNEEGAAIKCESETRSIDVHDCIFEDSKHASVYCIGSISGFEFTGKFNHNEFRCTSAPLPSGLNIQNYGGHIEVIDCSFIKLAYFETIVNNRVEHQVSPLTFVSNGYKEDFTFSGLTFSDCYGGNLRCFNLNARKPFTFSNNTIKDNTLGSFLGQINFNGFATSEDVFTFDNCKWLRNKCSSSFGGGVGLWLINNKNEITFTFDNCLFEENSQINKGGAFQDGDSNSVKTKKLNFFGCTFNNNEAGQSGGALAIETVLPWNIDGCKFNNNKAKGGNAENGGGAIFININDPISGSITNCNFVNNQATSREGTVLCAIAPSMSITFDGTNNVTNVGEGGSMISTNCSDLVLSHVTFDFKPASDDTKSDFRAVHITGGSTTFIGCAFRSTGLISKSESGQTIFSDQGTSKVFFNECDFRDCCHVAEDYAIVMNNIEEFQFIKSEFSFTDPDDCSSAILVNNRCTFKVIDSLFKDIHSKNSLYGSGIVYETNGKDRLNCNVEIVNTTFDNLGGRNGRAAFLKLAKFATIDNCTIKNMPDSGYILALGHEGQPQGQPRLTKVKFIDNMANCYEGGGGSGLWLSQTETYTLTECEFIRNINTGDSNGGALGYTPGTSSNAKISLEFDRCFFQDNKVKSSFNGGSLYIKAQYRPVIIKDCVFSNTIENAATRGGAIYIDGNTNQEISITNTEFRNMKVTEPNSNSGNALFIENGASNVIIQDCKFYDCGSNNKGCCIYSSGKNVIVERTNVTFTQTTSACKGILIPIKSHFELIDSTISNCVSTSNGGAFSYRDGLNEADPLESDYIENLVFINTIIDNCESGNGRAIYMTLTSYNTTFNNLIIQHVKARTGFILTIGHSLNDKTGTVLFEECKFIDCRTDNNDGGGLGFWCSDEKEIKFDNCLFQQLIAGQNGGAISFAARAPRRNTILSFDKCLFNLNEANVKGSALYIDITSQLHIYDCNFTNNNNKNQNNDGGGAIFITSNCRDILIEKTEFQLNTQESQASTGNAIYFEENQNEFAGVISECTFVNCGNKGSVVYSDGVDIEFVQNTISFTQPEIGAKGLHVPKSCNIHIANSTFSGCVSGSEGAGFVYDSRNNLNSSGLITLENTIFENNNASNGCAIYVFTNENPIVRDVTVRGHKKGTFIFTLLATKKFEEGFNIERCIFENNRFTGEDGGGAGICITQTTSDTMPVTFKGCTFRENYASNRGGAMAYGSGNSLSNIELTYQGCTFMNNVASKDGAALWINTEEPLVIDNCNFISNSLEREESSGNAIILKERTHVILTNTTLVNNEVKGSSILFEGQSFNAINSIIEFDSSKESSMGIELISKATIELESITFIQSSDIKKGKCICYHEAKYDRTSLMTIKNITFEIIKSIKGNSIDIEGILEELTIAECIFDSKFEESNSSIFLSFYPTSFGFMNNTMENFNGKETSNYFMYLNCNNNIETLEFVNITFLNNTSNSLYGGGSGVHIEGVSELFIIECDFQNNKASQESSISLSSKSYDNDLFNGNGGGFQIGRNCKTNGINISFENCIFRNNKADQHGGAISIQTTSTITITNCTFERNIANYKSKEGKGGSIYINPSFNYEYYECQDQDIAHQSNIQILNCNFINNEGYDGHAIYLSGEDYNNTINMTGNEFINEFDEASISHKSSIILDEICQISLDEILEENNFIYSNSKVSTYSQNCRSKSTSRFSPSDVFTKSGTFNNIAVVIPPTEGRSRKTTISKSYSLTYVERKSVSFSLSFFSSNTFEMSFDANEGTYLMVQSRTYYQEYFPYIIHYFSPSYIEQNVTIDIRIKKRISSEQLIGITCGSASVFFLVLGIIILAVRRRNELKNQFDEFDDLSSSEVEIKKNVDEPVIVNNNDDNKKKKENNDDFDDFLDFWV